MRIYLAGIILIGTLSAGCSSDWDPSRDVRAKASAEQQATPLPTATLAAREGATSFASLPDRGELLSYAKDREVRRSGAYTSHPVEISEAHALNAIAAGGLHLATPDGMPVNIAFDRIEEHSDGNWTWVGQSDSGNHAVLTFGESAVFGEFSSGGKSYRVTTRRGAAFVVETDPVLLARHPGHHGDGPEFLIPPDTSSLATTAPRGMVMAAADANVALKSAAAVVDLALGFTPGMVATYGNESVAISRLTSLVALGNAAYERSGVNRRVRLVHAMRVEYPDNTDNADALQKLTGYNSTTAQFTTPDPAFNGLRAARDQYGADLVALVRPHRSPEQKGCGIAWLIGANQRLITAADAPFGYSVVSDGSDLDESDSNTYFCSEYSLVHELGHSMGQAHNQQNSEYSGAHAYSYGYREAMATGFYTIMAYPLANSSQIEVPYFATPLINFASGRPYGVAATSDNVRSLNQTMPIVATFRAMVVPFTGNNRNDFNNDGVSDLLWRSGSRQFETWIMSGATLSSARGFQLPVGYRIMTSGDFNGDGFNDLLLTSAARDLILWEGNGTTFTPQSLNRIYGVEWSAIGQIDFDGDGKSDLLWKNNVTGAIETWVMNGPTLTRATGFNLPSGYSVLTTGDFNGDGFGDLLLGGPSRELLMWFGTGTSFNGQSLGRSYGLGWVVTGGVDVNADGKSDLLWRNDSSGQFETWIMDGPTLSTAAGYSLPAGYEIFGSGDYNGDGKLDLLLSSSQRELFMWFGTGTSFNGQALNRVYGAGWVADLDVRPFFAQKVTTDFNASGASDILWKSDAAGQFETWMMGGASLQRASGFGLPTGYRIMTTGDFNGDGHADLLLTSAARDTVMWFGNGVGFRGQSLARVYGVGWSAIGNFEVNGDGRSDLLWSNSTTGQFETWVMNGASLIQARGYNLPAGYTILTTGDFNGDGFSDLLIGNASRQLVMWFGTGNGGFNGQALNRQYGAGWVPIGQVDINGDGKSDLVWRDTASGQFETWQMDGAELTRAVGYVLPAGYGILGTGDFNGDGNTDLLIGNQSRQIAMWFSTGTSFNGQSLNRTYGAGWNVLSSF